MYKMYVEQVNDGETVFEKTLSFKSRDELQEAQNEAITAWIDMQGKYARISTGSDLSLSLKVSGSSDREIWTRIS